MKVLHITPSMSRSSGGPSSCTLNLLRGLNSLPDTEASVLTFAPASGDTLVADEAAIITLPRDMRTPMLASPSMRATLRRDAARYDIIHGNYLWTLPSHYAQRAAQRASRPYMLSIHGMLYPQALRVSSWKKRLILPLFQRRDLRTADCLHATCEAELQHIRNFGLTNPVALIPNCIDTDTIPAPVRHTDSATRTVGFVGRLDPIKNIDLLIHAAARTPHIHLSIIGDGDPAYRTTLTSLADRLMPGRVEWHGFKSGSELTRLMRTFDIQVLPSKSENFGMVVAEALVQGIPVIAGTGTPWQMLATHQCGLHVAPDIDALADAIAQLTSMSPDQLDAMGRRGQQLVADNFTPRAVATAMRATYAWLTGTAPRPQHIDL